MSSSAAMDDLESALQSLEVKMEGESSSASEMLVRHFNFTYKSSPVLHWSQLFDSIVATSWKSTQMVKKEDVLSVLVPVMRSILQHTQAL